MKLSQFKYFHHAMKRNCPSCHQFDQLLGFSSNLTLLSLSQKFSSSSESFQIASSNSWLVKSLTPFSVFSDNNNYCYYSEDNKKKMVDVNRETKCDKTRHASLGVWWLVVICLPCNKDLTGQTSPLVCQQLHSSLWNEDLLSTSRRLVKCKTSDVLSTSLRRWRG